MVLMQTGKTFAANALTNSSSSISKKSRPHLHATPRTKRIQRLPCQRNQSRRSCLLCNAISTTLSDAAIYDGKFSSDDLKSLKKSDVDKAANLASVAFSGSGFDEALAKVKLEMSGESDMVAPEAESKPRAQSIVNEKMLEKAMKMSKEITSNTGSDSEWKLAMEKCLYESEVVQKGKNFELVLDEQKVKEKSEMDGSELDESALMRALQTMREAFPQLDEEELTMCKEEYEADFEMSLQTQSESITGGDTALMSSSDIAAQSVVQSIISDTVSSIADEEKEGLTASDWSLDLQETFGEVVAGVASEVPTEGASIGEILTPFSKYTEAINGRLAMIGFLFGALGEMQTKTTVAQQYSESSMPAITLALGIIGASVIPATNDKNSLENASFAGFFNPKHEKMLGRIAMLGFLTLLIIESKFGSPFF